MEYPLSSDNITVKSKIIRAVHVGARIIIVTSIITPFVFSKWRAFFRPNTSGFIQRWLSPPYIYLVLNLVIISIFASPRLLHSLLHIFNYFREGKSNKSHAISDASKLSPPLPSVVSTTITTSSDDHFYQDWEDFVHDQTPTSLSPPLERDLFEDPWPDIKEVASSIKTPNSSGELGKIQKRNFAKIVKQRGEIVSPLSLPANLKKTREFDDDYSLESTCNAIKGRGEFVSSLPLIGNKDKKLRDLNSDDTLEGTWKTIVEGGDAISSHSLIRSKGGGVPTIKERRENVSPLFLHNTGKNNNPYESDENETLDATWRDIMEKGKTISSPLSLNECGMTNVPSRLISPRVPRQDALASWRELRKSETFNETMSARQRAGLRRDPSSLDDLNCRVESFIKNFNHQMLLQRQESEQRFFEMVNSGA